VYRDKLFSCLSNFAYSQSQKALGVGQGQVGNIDQKVARKWLQLEDRARQQIQCVDQEVEANTAMLLQKAAKEEEDQNMKSEESKSEMVVVEKSIDAAFFGLTQTKPVEDDEPLSEHEMVESRVMKEFFAYLAERLNT